MTRALAAIVVLTLVLGLLAERHIHASPCGATWDNGVALDAEDCAYMGGKGW